MLEGTISRRLLAVTAIATATSPDGTLALPPRDFPRVAYSDLEALPPTSKRVVLCRHGRTLAGALGLPTGRLVDVRLDG
eukprot:5418802-Prymnesium_polylepis.1